MNGQKARLDAECLLCERPSKARWLGDLPSKATEQSIHQLMQPLEGRLSKAPDSIQQQISSNTQLTGLPCKLPGRLMIPVQVLRLQSLIKQLQMAPLGLLAAALKQVQVASAGLLAAALKQSWLAWLTASWELLSR